MVPSLPGADTLHREYLPLLLPPHKEALKQLLFDKKVYIVADESTDSCYNINLNNVLGFVSDSAQYMKKAYKDILHGIIHIMIVVLPIC